MKNHPLKLLGLLAAFGPLAAQAQTPALTLTGGGTPLTVTGGALTVVGDARIDANTTLDNAGALSVSGTLAAPAGTVRLTGAGSQTVGVSGTVGELVLDKPSGTATLNKALAVADVLRLQGGTLVTSNQLTLLSTAARQAYATHAGGATSGNVAVQRYVPAPTAVSYHHMASPVQAAPLNDLAVPGFVPKVNAAYNNLPRPSLPPSQFPNVFGYDEARGGAANGNFNDGYFSPAALSTPLAPGRGYSVYIGGGRTPDFVGALTTGPVNVPLAVTGDPASNGKAGWALLGNPYPQPIDWDLLATPANVEASVYVWYSAGGANGAYRVRNASGVGNLTDGLIGVGQAFFVRATAAATFPFTNALRVEANAGLGRTAAAQRPLLTLTLSGTTGTDEATVYVQPGATEGYDGAYDAARPGRNVGVPTLSALIGGQEAMLSAISPQDLAAGQLIELAATVPAAGAYTLRVGNLAFLSGVGMVLRDRLTGTAYDLHQAPVVQFTTPQAGTLTGRFALELNLSRALGTNSELTTHHAPLEPFPNPASGGGSVRVAGCLGNSSVAVFDVAGRRVAMAVADAMGVAEVATRGLATGVYSVRAADGRTARLVVE